MFDAGEKRPRCVWWWRWAVAGRVGWWWHWCSWASLWWCSWGSCSTASRCHYRVGVFADPKQELECAREAARGAVEQSSQCGPLPAAGTSSLAMYCEGSPPTVDDPVELPLPAPGASSLGAQPLALGKTASLSVPCGASPRAPSQLRHASSASGSGRDLAPAALVPPTFV